jgi:hypothetical protein
MLRSLASYFAHFGPEIHRPETTLAQKQLRPRDNFGPVNTSAQRILWPGVYFGQIDFGLLHFGPRTKLLKVTFFIIFDLP